MVLKSCTTDKSGKQEMLNACHGEWNKENIYQFAPKSLMEVCDLVDQLASTRPISSYPGGASGDHGWIILSDRGFDLEVYFGETTREDSIVSFVLYGPCKAKETKSIFDGRGLTGDITTDHLKAVLALLDEGSSPIDFLHRKAIEISVVSD